MKPRNSQPKAKAATRSLNKQPLSGVELIAAERARQISKEGYDATHDDEHNQDELAIAAACYALPKNTRGYVLYSCRVPLTGESSVLTMLDKLWYLTGWDKQWWRPTPKDRRRELAKAGALIAAEIDRLNRPALNSPAHEA